MKAVLLMIFFRAVSCFLWLKKSSVLLGGLFEAFEEVAWGADNLADFLALGIQQNGCWESAHAEFFGQFLVAGAQFLRHFYFW